MRFRSYLSREGRSVAVDGAPFCDTGNVDQLDSVNCFDFCRRIFSSEMNCIAFWRSSMHRFIATLFLSFLILQLVATRKSGAIPHDSSFAWLN